LRYGLSNRGPTSSLTRWVHACGLRPPAAEGGERQERVAECSLSKREIIRRLGTSARQFYWLLDPPPNLTFWNQVPQITRQAAQSCNEAGSPGRTVRR
jgi:hypothetical protein